MSALPEDQLSGVVTLMKQRARLAKELAHADARVGEAMFVAPYSKIRVLLDRSEAAMRELAALDEKIARVTGARVATEADRERLQKDREMEREREEAWRREPADVAEMRRDAEKKRPKTEAKPHYVFEGAPDHENARFVVVYPDCTVYTTNDLEEVSFPGRQALPVPLPAALTASTTESGGALYVGERGMAPPGTVAIDREGGWVVIIGASSQACCTVGAKDGMPREVALAQVLDRLNLGRFASKRGRELAKFTEQAAKIGKKKKKKHDRSNSHG